MSIFTIVEMHELWTETAGRGVKIRWGTLEQLLESPRKIRVNGRASEAVKVLAKNNCVLMGRKWLNDSPKLGENIIMNKFAYKVSTSLREIRAFSWWFKKHLDRRHTEFSFHGTTTSRSSTYQMAALLLSKAVSVQLSVTSSKPRLWGLGPYGSWYQTRSRWRKATTPQPSSFQLTWPLDEAALWSVRKAGRSLL